MSFKLEANAFKIKELESSLEEMKNMLALHKAF